MTGSPRIDRGGGRRPGAPLPVARRARAVRASDVDHAGGVARLRDRSAASCRTRRARRSRGRWSRPSAPGRPPPSPTGIGRFELRTLAPGPYLRSRPRHRLRRLARTDRRSPGERAHASSIALRHASAWLSARPVDADAERCPCSPAGLAGAAESQAPAADDPGPVAPLSGRIRQSSPADDDHSETAWRLRHLRRGILKDITRAGRAPGGRRDAPETAAFGCDPSGRSAAGSAGMQRQPVFAGMPFTGQFNLLTTGSFDSPRAAVQRRQLLAQHRLCLARGACRRARRTGRCAAR